MKREMFLLPLFIYMSMVCMSSAGPVAEAEADPNPEPLNVYVDIIQNVGVGSGPVDAPEDSEEPEVEGPTAMPDDDLFEINGQEFKFFPNPRITFDEAKDLCSSEGLQMAEPDDSSAQDLQDYLQSVFPSDAVAKFAWVGATALHNDAQTEVISFNWLNGEGGPARELQYRSDNVTLFGEVPDDNFPAECVTLDAYIYMTEGEERLTDIYANIPCRGYATLYGEGDGEIIEHGVVGVLCQKV